MKNRVFIPTLLFAVAMVALSGCDPTLITDGGRQVKFTAVSKSTTKTKTFYGDTLNSFQMISWKANDQIRIYCPKVENSDDSGIMSYNGGTTTWNETDQELNLDYFYADYKIASVNNRDFPASKATLANVDQNGLIWMGSNNATFYAAYPYGTPIGSSKNNQLCFELNIPAGKTGSATTGQTGDPADVVNMPLLSINPNVSSGSEVNLDFYPAFSAFEFNIKSADETSLTIDSFELVSNNNEATQYQYLTGRCYYDLNRLPQGSHFLPNNEITFVSGSKSLKIDVGQTITQDTEASFTLFTLPCSFNQLSIKVTFTPEGGSQTTKTLKLQQNDTWISFPAGHKTVIKGLALKGGQNWQLIIKTDVNDWTLVEKTTTFSEQIGIRKENDPIEGETETTNHYADSLGVVEGAPGYPTGYGKYYQIRTLNMAPANPHFVMKFIPFAPIGGYWKLVPQGIGAGSLQHFDVKVYLGEGEYSDDLTGQIMGQEVEIHIFPKDFDPDAGESYAMILRCYFSAQKDFDEAYSADSEFQDVHGDGRYSYWRFTLPSSN